MSRIKKIYSSENAGELQEMLGRGLVVVGYYGNTIKMVKYYAERGYPPEELRGVMEEGHEHRFIRVPLTYKLFGVVSVYERADVTDMEVDGVEWISFSEFRKNLKKRFEEETGWDENRLGDDGLGADLTLHLNYESAYTAWLEIQLAMPQRVKDVPEIEKGEDDGV